MRARTRIDSVFSLVFVVAICLPFIGRLFMAPDAISKWENRNLNPMPSLEILSEGPSVYRDAFESFFDDQFGFRQQLLYLNKRIKLAAGVSPHKDAILANDGWLFHSPGRTLDQNRGAMPMPPVLLDGFRTEFSRLWEELEKRGIAFVLMIAPEKHTIYREYLPKSIKYLGPSWRFQLAGLLNQGDMPFVDPTDALLAKKGGDLPLYYKTDSHWNCYGAFLAYQELMDVIEAMPAIRSRRVHPGDVRLRIKTHPSGLDIAQNLIGMPQMFREPNYTTCTVREQAPLQVTNMSDGSVGDREQEVFWAHTHWRMRQIPPDSTSRVLVVRDSYFTALVHFLNQTFAEVHYVHHEGLKFDWKLIDQIKPDLVIYEFVERVLYASPALFEPAIGTGGSGGLNLTTLERRPVAGGTEVRERFDVGLPTDGDITPRYCTDAQGGQIPADRSCASILSVGLALNGTAEKNCESSRGEG